jgi:hypothetical protein
MSSNHTLSLHRPTSNSSSTNFPWLSPTENWLTRSSDCLQDNSSARTHGKHRVLFVKDAYLQLRCVAVDVVLFRAFAWRRPHRKHSFPYIVVTFSTGVFTGSRIKTAILLLLRNLATDFLPRICLRGNLFTNPLPGNNALTYHVKVKRQNWPLCLTN